MRSLEKIDRWIAVKVKHWSSIVAGEPRRGEMLEIRRDILEDIRDHVVPKGQGKNVFPYQSVAIRIAAANPEEREMREGAFAGEGGIEEDIRGLLVEAGCDVASDFTITVEAVEDGVLAAAPRPFHIEYSARKAAAQKKPAARPTVKLTTLKGEADPPECTSNSERINIGRLREVYGDREGLRRRNDIAFADTETTVSREHAYIRYNASEGRFRLYDSGSQRGTSIYREGRRIDVPRGSSRGIQLQSGDEIHIGEARVKFDVAL